MSEPEPRVAPWEDLVLRLIAIYKLAKTILFMAIGIGLLRIMHHNAAQMLQVYVLEPMHFDPENHLLQPILEKLSHVTKHQIESAGLVAFFYAAIFGTEGVGLYLRKHWAEYLVLISTGLLLPLEFWAIYEHVAAWKIVITVGNLAILLYLAHRLWLDAHSRRQDLGGKPLNPGFSKGKTKEARGRAVSKVR